MSVDTGSVSEETPDAVVEVHVDAPDDGGDDGGGDTTVVVVESGDDNDNDTELDHEHRITALEHEVAELRRQFITESPSREEVHAIVDEAVVETVVAADVIAEETAAEVAEETVEEVVDEVVPHRTHWLERSFGEWFGKNGSGKVDRK